MFVITYGLLFMLVPMVLGTFFSMPTMQMNSDWQAIYNENVNTIQWLVPITPAIGVFILVIKVLMVASNKGRD